MPKCGGSSVEAILKMATGTKLSFLDRGFLNTRARSWSTSSPQHITGKSLSRLFPNDFFDEYFTVTRHPVERFTSAFAFHKYITRKIPLEIDINQFVDEIAGIGVMINKYDNHFLPMVYFLYPDTHYNVFKLEDGLNNVKKYIGNIFEIEVENIPIPYLLKNKHHSKSELDVLSIQSRNIIEKIYEIDFLTFKY